MKYIRILCIVAGIAIFLFGAGAVVNAMVNPVKTTGQWYLTVGGMLLTGAAVSTASYKILPKVSNSTPTVKDEVEIMPTPEVKQPTDTKVISGIELDKGQLTDYECLNHLTKRFFNAKDVEAIEYCKKLQERMFELHYGQNPKVEVPAIS